MNFKQRKKEFFEDALIHETLSNLFCDGWKSHLLSDSSGKIPMQVAKERLFKSFSQSLSDYKKELVEEIEKLDRPSHIDDTEGYYDLAIEDILSLLQKDKEISK